jgi:transcriptional regulator with XRE-family HTH domain
VNGPRPGDPLTRYVAARITWFRKTRGWSQRELAEKTGLSAPCITSYEAGSRGIPLRSVGLIAEAFGVRPWVLIMEDCPVCRNKARPGWVCGNCGLGSR